MAHAMDNVGVADHNPPRLTDDRIAAVMRRDLQAPLRAAVSSLRCKWDPASHPEGNLENPWIIGRGFASGRAPMRKLNCATLLVASFRLFEAKRPSER